MNIYNNMFMLLIFTFIIISIFFTFIVKPQFLNIEIKNCKKYEDFIEKFENTPLSSSDYNNTTLKAYKNGVNFHTEPYITDYSGFKNKYPVTYYDAENNKPLLTYLCTKLVLNDSNDVDNLETMINMLYTNFYVSVIDTYITNSDNIVNKISEDLDKFLRISGEYKIEGPVYALIYQSPYLRYNNKEITARYDVINNQLSTYKQNIIGDIPETGNQPLFAKIIMLYPLYLDYNKSGKIIKLTDGSGSLYFKNTFNEIKSRDNSCYLYCNNDNSLFCGCLNKKKSTNPNDNASYDSTCVDNMNTKTNYGMVYTLNPDFPIFINKLYLHS